MDSEINQIIIDLVGSICNQVGLSLQNGSDERLYYKTLQEAALDENITMYKVESTSSTDDSRTLQQSFSDSFSECTPVSQLSIADSNKKCSEKNDDAVTNIYKFKSVLNNIYHNTGITSLVQTTKYQYSLQNQSYLSCNQTAESDVATSSSNSSILLFESHGKNATICNLTHGSFSSNTDAVGDVNCNELINNKSDNIFSEIDLASTTGCTEPIVAQSSPTKTINSMLISHKLVAESSDFGAGNFLKGCSWAPDGLCFLSSTNDKFVRIFNTPYQCLNCDIKNEMIPLNLETCIKVREPGTVYDYCWWPLMNSSEPVTCCFATTASNQPIHLWDAFDGKLRASYIALNSVQEVASAYSLCFSKDGQQLLCGFKKDVCLFYTDRPGAYFERWTTMKKNQRKSQNNIISCMEFCHDDSMFACGAYDGTVGFYSPINGHLLDFTAAHKTGVTYLKFSRDGYRLYTGVRNGSLLKVWDMRNLKESVCSMERQVSTNQRIYFDLIQNKSTYNDHYLVSGSTDGSVYFYEMTNVLKTVDQTEMYKLETIPVEPAYVLKAHDDCCNGCSIHPFLPLLLTSSGQRNYLEFCDSDDETSYSFRKTKLEENKVKMWYLTNATS